MSVKPFLLNSFICMCFQQYSSSTVFIVFVTILIGFVGFMILTNVRFNIVCCPPTALDHQRLYLCSNYHKEAVGSFHQLSYSSGINTSCNEHYIIPEQKHFHQQTMFLWFQSPLCTAPSTSCHSSIPQHIQNHMRQNQRYTTLIAAH